MNAGAPGSSITNPLAAQRDVEQDDREQCPRLRFPAASIAVHMLLRDIEKPDASRDDEFTYHQREFLSYAHRDVKPLLLDPVTPPPDLKHVTCHFPAITYQTADRKRWLPSRADDHPFEVLLSRAYFPSSDLSVLLVVFRSLAAESHAPVIPVPLTEFGVIRIAKLWEGGEGAPEVRIDSNGTHIDGAIDGAPWVRFRPGNGELLDFAGLLNRIRTSRFPGSKFVVRPAGPIADGQPSRPYLTGSIQLRTHSADMVRLSTELRELQESSPAHCGKPKSDPVQLIALSGVLRALMAFDDTHPHELPSIFKETIADQRLITAIHKGTFMRMAETMRMPSAYFLMPHSIALHNEALLDAAVEQGYHQLGVGNGSGRSGRTSLAADPLEAARRSINQKLDQCVDAAAIHYPNLRELYERAATSRGLKGLEVRARRYSDELRVEADAIRARQQSIAQLVIAVLALVLAAIQVKDTIPLVFGIVGALVLAGAGVLLYPIVTAAVRRGYRRRAGTP